MPKTISSKKKWEIIFLHINNQGPRLSIAKTGKQLKLSLSCVKHWIRVFRETGGFEEEKGSGRPRKSSKREDQKIVKMTEDNKEMSVKDLSQNLKEKGLSLSYSTIRRRLIEAGLKFGTASSKPFLTEIQKIYRVRFAKRNKNRNWNNVLFTDEATISLSPRNKRFWKRRGENVYIRRYKHYQKIHIWGSFSKFGFGKIYLFKENLTGNKLIEIYEKALLPSSRMIKAVHWILVEDNDPKHTSKVAETWREKHNIDRISWPSNSPDINPIENIWSLLKDKIAELKPSNLDQLEKNIKTIWSNLPRNLAETLVLSMSDRMKQVIEKIRDSLEKKYGSAISGERQQKLYK